MKLERGSATLWVLAAVALVALVTATATVRAIAVVARHRAEAAADLAALAAANHIGTETADACADAGRVAAANGAQLVSCALVLDADGRSGQVSVVVGAELAIPFGADHRVTASARAGRSPSRAPPVSSGPAAPDANPGKRPR